MYVVAIRPAERAVVIGPREELLGRGVVAREVNWLGQEPAFGARVAVQVRRFLSELLSAGAFASVPPDQAFYVICDERINEASEPHLVNLLVQFAATHAGEYHSFMVSHSVNGATVRPVMVNRLEASLIVAPELEQEITIRIDPRDGSLLSENY